MRVLSGAILLSLCATAQAGIVFQPHLSEYSRLPAGQYTEGTFVFTEIEAIYDRDENKVALGLPFVPEGASTDAMLGLLKYLWIGNIFRDTDIWFLKDHPQFCRAIGVVGYQQNTEQIASRVRLFGKTAGSNGLGDLFTLCGVWTDEYRWGPIKANGLWAGTIKWPVGHYNTDAALNVGTNYWTYIPQFAFHAEAFGRLYIDGTLAYQINEDNEDPSFGGLTPTGIPNWKNAEVNFAWKFNEHWFADIGYSFRESDGPNTYDQLTINFKDQPLSPESACANTNAGLDPTLGMIGVDPLITPEICNNPALDQFWLAPRQPGPGPGLGPYVDRGVMGQAITAGFYYVYRTSSVFNIRVFYPIAGRGSVIDAVFDVCATESDCEDADGDGFADNPVDGAELTTQLYGVQEAAAVSATPFFEARFVYLFWAP